MLALLRFCLIAVLFVAAFEWTARRAGALDPTEKDDPYKGFPGTPPLYRVATAKDGSEIRERSPNQGDYRFQTFAREKAEREFRVFCLGGSSVRSDAFMDPDGSFPFMLALYLRAALVPARASTVTVVNAGGGGKGSIQNLETLREVLEYEPDLIVMYPEGGEKNFIPPNPAGVRAREDDDSPLKVAARRQLAKLRLYLGLRDLYQWCMPRRAAAGGAASPFSAYIAAIVSQPFVPEKFLRLLEFKDDRVPPLMEAPIPAAEIAHAHARFKKNLAAMAELCRDRGVPLVFVLPVRNLRHSFYLRFHITPEEIAGGAVDAWRAAYERALALEREGKLEEAVAALRAVRAMYVQDDDEILCFHLGKCLERLARKDEALEEFAKPYLRHPMRRQIEEVARDEGVALVDPYPALLAISDSGVPGYEEFTDSFHPMPKTNRVIARAIYEGVARLEPELELPPLSAQPLEQVDRGIARLLAMLDAPLANQMLRAMLAGNPDEAIRLARQLPETEMVERRYVEPLYYLWALTRKGDLEAAGVFFRKLREHYMKILPRRQPLLDRDEDIVRIAFAGDIFHWF